MPAMEKFVLQKMENFCVVSDNLDRYKFGPSTYPFPQNTLYGAAVVMIGKKTLFHGFAGNSVTPGGPLWAFWLYGSQRTLPGAHDDQTTPQRHMPVQRVIKE